MASLEKRDVPKPRPRRLLETLKTDLIAGIAWDKACMTAADKLVDEERSPEEGPGGLAGLSAATRVTVD